MWMLGVLAMLLSTTAMVGAQPSTGHEEKPTAPAWALGGEVRQQYERFSYEEWGALPDDRTGYLLQRYMLHVTRRIGSRAMARVELKSGIETGRRGGPRVPDEDRLDVHQAYGEIDAGPVSVRAGRQELQFGSSRLVSVRDLNVRQSFDAARVTVRRHSWQADLFGGRPVHTRAGALDDATDAGRALWGAYVVRQPGTSPRTGIDVYYLGYRRRGARFDSAAGLERRHSAGVRFWGQPRAVDYNIEVVGQWGSVDGSRIRAWTVASETGYCVPLRLEPRVALRADVTSGDHDPGDDTTGTFNALFPKGAYFGQIASAGPANHIDLNPHVELHVRRDLVATVGWLMFWRQELRDGIYTVSGRLLRSGLATRARFVGHSPSLTVVWQRYRRLSLSGDLSAFTAGPFIRESGSDQRSLFIRASATYGF